LRLATLRNRASNTLFNHSLRKDTAEVDGMIRAGGAIPGDWAEKFTRLQSRSRMTPRSRE